MTTTNSNIKTRAEMAGDTAARQPSGRRQGGTRRRVVCASPSAYNPGGEFRHGRASRLGGVLRRGRRQVQKIQS